MPVCDLPGLRLFDEALIVEEPRRARAHETAGDFGGGRVFLSDLAQRGLIRRSSGLSQRAAGTSGGGVPGSGSAGMLAVTASRIAFTAGRSKIVSPMWR